MGKFDFQCGRASSSSSIVLVLASLIKGPIKLGVGAGFVILLIHLAFVVFLGWNWLRRGKFLFVRLMISLTLVVRTSKVATRRELGMHVASTAVSLRLVLVRTVAVRVPIVIIDLHLVATSPRLPLVKRLVLFEESLVVGVACRELFLQILG